MLPEILMLFKHNAIFLTPKMRFFILFCGVLWNFLWTFVEFTSFLLYCWSSYVAFLHFNRISVPFEKENGSFASVFVEFCGVFCGLLWNSTAFCFIAEVLVQPFYVLIEFQYLSREKMVHLRPFFVDFCGVFCGLLWNSVKYFVRPCIL